MSQYTMELREIIENGVDIFDFDYPIFDEAYRSTLEQNIINYYYFREIGVETIGRFLFNLKARLLLIMPNFNEIYKTTLYDIDPLSPYHVTESYTRTNTGSGKVNNTTNQSDNNLYSDTPMGRITLQPDGSDQTYVTQVTEDTAISSGETTSSSDGSEDYDRTMTGHIGVQTYGDLIMNYRKSLINVDQMIIKELHDLFMQVY